MFKRYQIIFRYLQARYKQKLLEQPKLKSWIVFGESKSTIYFNFFFILRVIGQPSEAE